MNSVRVTCMEMAAKRASLHFFGISDLWFVTSSLFFWSITKAMWKVTRKTISSTHLCLSEQVIQQKIKHHLQFELLCDARSLFHIATIFFSSSACKRGWCLCFLERVMAWKPCVWGDAISKWACVLLFPECSVFWSVKTNTALGFFLNSIISNFHVSWIRRAIKWIVWGEHRR